jgi:hypothetical protein
MEHLSLKNKILQCVKKRGFRVFSVSDFTMFAEYKAVSKCLERMVDEGKLFRLTSGLYGLKKYDSELRIFVPFTPDEIAHALARKFGWSIIPGKDSALNQLGFSTQVPARTIYLSTGPYKTYRIAGFTLFFQHSFHKEISSCSEITSLFAEALRTLGKDQADIEQVKRALSFLNEKDKQTLKNESSTLTAWIARLIQKSFTETEGVQNGQNN